MEKKLETSNNTFGESGNKNLIRTRRIDELDLAIGKWVIDPGERDKRLQETGQYNVPEDANTHLDREVK